jgi:hypothetical protein
MRRTVMVSGSVLNPTDERIQTKINFHTREGGAETVTEDTKEVVVPPGRSVYRSQFKVRDDTGPDVVSFQI